MGFSHTTGKFNLLILEKERQDKPFPFTCVMMVVKFGRPPRHSTRFVKLTIQKLTVETTTV